MQLAERMKPLQANVFADMDRAKARARAAGQTILDLSLGSSDLPADPHVLDAIAASLTDRSTHGYCLFSGTQAWRTRHNFAFLSKTILDVCHASSGTRKY